MVRTQKGHGPEGSSPPVLPVTDAAILGSKVDGVLVVHSLGKIGRNALRRVDPHLAGGLVFGAPHLAGSSQRAWLPWTAR